MAGRKKGRIGGWMVPTAVVAVLAGVLGSGVMVWKASEAAFTATTANPTNNWAAGSVALVDDDSEAAMFNVSGLTPTGVSTGEKCIAVTYNGSATAPVKLYGAVPGGTGLAGYLRLKVEMGTGGGFGSCTGWTETVADIFPDALMSTWTATGWANGLTTWTPTGTGQTRVFKFTYTLVDNNAANGKTASMPFTWEAQA
ncbi:hypothetical protein [Spirilliplanes yamanashiensis]|uniref:SipW-cognate class signal peptide n=1 Tax=Spirilliplanes yamanashiensis TaxID=42233 RepID=A0A8J3Y701_9ACTN|nr:hypothetical protein [Spirilliplanes yamanashiensis]MDP9814799.1 hypothetical protein [Spirilliplanes yamanashiensis]GIJ02453.1 hypothetical protein Sya03_18050 [Spirilliplanes yamanashiensis]